MNRMPAIIAALLIIIIALAAIGYKIVVDNKYGTPHAVPNASLPGKQSAPTPSTSGSPAVSSSLTHGGVIYVVKSSGGDANDLAPVPVTWDTTQAPARAAINALVHVKDSPIPSGTALRGIKIEDGLATVDFTSAFQTNFHGSETQEAQTINSILRTLGQFPDIDRVQILVQGKPIDALSQLSISDPLDVIRPDTVRQAKSTSGAASQ